MILAGKDFYKQILFKILYKYMIIKYLILKKYLF